MKWFCADLHPNFIGDQYNYGDWNEITGDNYDEILLGLYTNAKFNCLHMPMSVGAAAEIEGDDPLAPSPAHELPEVY